MDDTQRGGADLAASFRAERNAIEQECHTRLQAVRDRYHREFLDLYPTARTNDQKILLCRRAGMTVSETAELLALPGERVKERMKKLGMWPSHHG